MVPLSTGAVHLDADKVYATNTRMYVTTNEFRICVVSNSHSRSDANHKTDMKFMITKRNRRNIHNYL